MVKVELSVPAETGVKVNETVQVELPATWPLQSLVEVKSVLSVRVPGVRVMACAEPLVSVAVITAETVPVCADGKTIDVGEMERPPVPVPLRRRMTGADDITLRLLSAKVSVSLIRPERLGENLKPPARR